MTWRTADSLLTLLDEVNQRFPNRSKSSDGSIGDLSHQNRSSDHNPWVDDPTSPLNVVTALDITDDSAPGVPEIADLVVKTLVDRRDKRVKYIIHEGKIWRSYDKPGIPAWTPGPYTGPNGHFTHVHVSVQPTKALYDNTTPWGLLPVGKTRGGRIDKMIELGRVARRIAPKKGRRRRVINEAVQKLLSLKNRPKTR